MNKLTSNDHIKNGVNTTISELKLPQETLIEYMNST